MNDRQALVACVAGVAVLLSGLFPPWRLTVREPLPENVTPRTFYVQQDVWVGYAFVLAPPREGTALPAVSGTARVDAGLLLAEWAVILGAAMLAAALLRERRPQRP
jgi:hypothetical protein